MDKVSIVTACYNAADDVRMCWESLKRQTYGIDNLECIFVDDASTDNGKTLAVLHEIEAEAPDNVLIVESDRNRGPGGAINLGISYATGGYLQIMGADDEIADDAIEKLHLLAAEYDTDIIQYNHTLIMGDQRRVNKVSVGNRLYTINTHSERIPFLNSTTVTYGCTNKFYKMDLIRKTGVRFAENVVYEEPLFVYPLFLYANRVYLCEEGFYYYYLHSGSIVTSRIGRNLLNHPQVQLMTLEDCMKRTELYAEYKDVISCYFLWSYYCETLFFASEHTDAFLPVEYLSEMQNVCKSLYPDWRNNPQIINTSDSVKDMLETLDVTFEDQKQLNEYIASLREAG
ncbi:MAG: glycosyltransferase family 2 protein [Lachnospiraceae bacterium]|nr:glycosyltransferase family 2 protein [Lachnospiraceae bacterium]